MQERTECPIPPLFLQKIELTGVRGWGSAKGLKRKGLGERGLECRECPLPAPFLKRHDSKEVRRWWSVNDMTEKDLEKKK